MTSKLKIKTACYFMAVNALQNHPNSVIRFLGPFYDRRNVNKALATTNLALVKSKRDLTVLKNSYNFDATYLPDAISDSFSSSNKGRSNDFRTRFGIKQEHFFLFIGRLHKLKGPQILVKALKYVGDEIAAVFIGPDDGYMKETLRLAEHLNIKDKIYVLGYLDEATKVQAIDSSVALVNPSLSDNVEVYSTVISEAWARKKPVIASSVGEIPFRVEHGVNGLLVEPSNYKMLAEAMRNLCRNNKLSQALGKEGKRTVFSWNQVASRSIELYQQV